MFCNKCGASLPDGSNNCSYCGAVIKKQKPKKAGNAFSSRPGNTPNFTPGSGPGNVPNFTPGSGPGNVPNFTPGSGPGNVPNYNPGSGQFVNSGRPKPIAVGKAVGKPSGKSALIITISILSVLTIAIVSAIIIIIVKKNNADSQTAGGKSDKIEASADNDPGSSTKQSEKTEKSEATTAKAAASEKSDAVTTETAVTEGTTEAASSEESTYEEVTSEEASSEVNITEELTEASTPSPFYGIWCYGTKYESDAEDFAAELRANGFESHVFVTTDWSDLNSEKYYVVSAGVFSSESDAESDLERVHSAGYSDAYVKYSGEYIGD